MIKKILLSAILVVSAVQMSVGQDSNGANQNVTIKIESIASMDFEKLVDIPNFVFDNADDLEGGLTSVNIATVQVRANKDWKITAGINREIINNYTGVFKVLVDDRPAVTLTGDPIDLIGDGVKGTSDLFNLRYEVIPGLEMEEGDYEVQIIYNLTNR
ncbi:hypothetical protein [Litoribacter populi]|uniref:hypothetical protein n=1 Tax=Litoribacter populi TaxID=2598460 RepID=UPI001180A170|nr:hypothetical protein [Litoribacter populi]